MTHRLYANKLLVVDSLDYTTRDIMRAVAPARIYKITREVGIVLVSTPDLEPDHYRIYKNRYLGDVFRNLGIEITHTKFLGGTPVDFGMVRMSEGDIIALALSL